MPMIPTSLEVVPAPYCLSGLKTVTPPHSIGAAMAGGISLGIYNGIRQSELEIIQYRIRACLDDEVGRDTSIVGVLEYVE